MKSEYQGHFFSSARFPLGQVQFGLAVITSAINQKLPKNKQLPVWGLSRHSFPDKVAKTFAFSAYLGDRPHAFCCVPAPIRAYSSPSSNFISNLPREKIDIGSVSFTNLLGTFLFGLFSTLFYCFWCALAGITLFKTPSLFDACGSSSLCRAHWQFIFDAGGINGALSCL